MPAVVGALELHDLRAARRRPGQSDRVIGGLRPGIREQHSVGRGHVLDDEPGDLQFLGSDSGPDQVEIGQRRRHPGMHRLISVPQKDGAERCMEIQILVAVCIPDPGALGPNEGEDGIEPPDGALHPARDI